VGVNGGEQPAQEDLPDQRPGPAGQTDLDLTGRADERAGDMLVGVADQRGRIGHGGGEAERPLGGQICVERLEQRCWCDVELSREGIYNLFTCRTCCAPLVRRVKQRLAQGAGPVVNAARRALAQLLQGRHRQPPTSLVCLGAERLQGALLPLAGASALEAPQLVEQGLDPRVVLRSQPVGNEPQTGRADPDPFKRKQAPSCSARRARARRCPRRRARR